MTFGAHKLVHSEPFLNYPYELWQLLSVLCSDVRKINLYRFTSTFSALNNCGGIFFRSLSYLHEVVRTNLSADFDFSQFLTAISRKLWCHLATKMSAVCLKEQCLLKKMMKTLSKLVYKWQRNACLNYAPLERTVLLTWSVTNKQKHKTWYKHHIFKPTARHASYDLLQTLHGESSSMPSKKVPIIFGLDAIA